MKTYIGLSRDHSASMRPLTKAAMADYNNTIQTLKQLSIDNNQDTIVSVVRCGSEGKRGGVDNEVVNSSIAALNPLTSYHADAGDTPLFDSVGRLIELFETTPDASDPEVSFLITVITDGEENSSRQWSSSSLMRKINELQKTDRWTFTFRVPRGQSRALTQAGVPAGNILEWDTSSAAGLTIAAAATQEAFSAFYAGRSAGTRSTDSFYTNIAHVSSTEVKEALVNISDEVSLWEVQVDSAIKPFVEHVTNKPFVTGTAFYQLTKKEDEVQDYKQIAIRDRTSGCIYSAKAARQMLNLPAYGTVKVAPGDHGNYDIYIQSTSVNRKLPSGSKVLVWPQAKLAKK